MMIPVWIYIVIWGFAALGAVTFVCRVKTVWTRIISTANDLASTLKDATEIARAYREDLAILRQIAQSGTGQQLGDEPESIIPQPPAVPATMPPPAEPTGEVDVTATEEEILEQERNESAAGFEVTERMKAATRDADNARIRELADYGISEKPE
jgi:hypothetical protein